MREIKFLWCTFLSFIFLMIFPSRSAKFLRRKSYSKAFLGNPSFVNKLSRYQDDIWRKGEIGFSDYRRLIRKWSRWESCLKFKSKLFLIEKLRSLVMKDVTGCWRAHSLGIIFATSDSTGLPENSHRKNPT